MNARRGIQWNNLWQQEDWISVWIGFLVLMLFIGGFKFMLPQWGWMNDETFATKIQALPAKIDALSEAATQSKENVLRDSLLGLHRALESKERSSIAEAAGVVAHAAQNAQDKDLQKKAGKLGKDVKKEAESSLSHVFSRKNILQAAVLFFGLWIFALIGMAAMGKPLKQFSAGFPLLFLLACLSFFIAGNAAVSYYGLEVVFWALLFGLAISNTVGIPLWLRQAVNAEYFIKIGVVLLGAEVLFSTMAKVGAYGMAQAIIVILAVFYVCYWTARKFGLDDEFASIMGAAVSICGVSAAIAAGGAVKGDPKKVSHTISLVLLCAVPMLIIQPIIVKSVGMPPAVAGAWLGGTIDTTGAVAAAGAIAGDEALPVAVVVKMAQNVFIGFAAFLLAFWFSIKSRESAGKASLKEVWTRFPKFVIGFIAASVVFSFFLSESDAKSVTVVTSGIRSWWFTLAFLCIGLDTKFKELVAMGRGKPAAAFLIAQSFNIFWTLLFAYLIFGGVLLPVPSL